MLILLPDKMDGVKALENFFLSDSSQFQNLLENLTLHNVVLALPKFKFDSDIDLKLHMNNVSTDFLFFVGKYS